MSKAKAADNPNVGEPSVEIVEAFEPAGEKLRLEWAENSGDWAFAILRFLQGSRRQEILLSEVEGTKFYARCNEQEQSALRYMAAQAEQLYLLSEEDDRRLRERDNFLVRYADRKTLGHQNWADEICRMPAFVAERAKFDQATFSNVYPQKKLFAWVWERRPGGNNDGDAPMPQPVVCKAPDCERQIFAHNLCVIHYTEFRGKCIQSGKWSAGDEVR